MSSQTLTPPLHRLASALPVDPPSGKSLSKPEGDATTANQTSSYNCGGETFQCRH